MLSSGLCSDRKYERKECAYSSIRNAIRAGFLAFAVYLPETATSELSVGDRSRLVVSPRRAHTDVKSALPCCHRVCAATGSMSGKSGLTARSGMQSEHVFWPLRSILPETATSELSVDDRSHLVVSPRRAHTDVNSACPCCHGVCAATGSMSGRSALTARSGMQSVQVFWPLRSVSRKQQQASSV